MGAVKRMAEDVAERMEIEDISDPRVLVEVDRLLSINHRRLVVIETHPNSGGYWTGKVGTEREILDYLKQLEKDGTMDYVFAILELKAGVDHETSDWLELDGCEPIGLRKVKIGRSPEGTPPLPGLEKRLAGIECSAYGTKKSAWAILQSLTDGEIDGVLSDLLQSLLQSGRELPVWEQGKCQDIRCPKCGSEELVKASEYPNALFVGGYRVHRKNGTLGEWWICRSPSCEDGQKNDYSILASLDGDEDA